MYFQPMNRTLGNNTQGNNVTFHVDVNSSAMNNSLQFPPTCGSFWELLTTALQKYLGSPTTSSVQ